MLAGLSLLLRSGRSQRKIAVCHVLVGRAQVRIHGDGRLSFFDRAFEVADALKDSPEDSEWGTASRG